MASGHYQKNKDLPVDASFWVVTFWVAACIIIALITTLSVIIGNVGLG